MIQRLSLFVLSLFLFSCTSLYELPRSAEDHFVIIFIGATSKNPKDPVDKNVFLLEAAAVYNEYIKRDVPAANIYVLYSDASFDKEEPFLNGVSKEFMEEFNGGYNNQATLKNLNAIEDKVDDQLSSKSVLHLVMNAHGRVDAGGFYMHSEHDNRFMRSEVINDMIEGNRGLTHLFVGSCYSGALIDEIDEGTGYLITGANGEGSCWLDRDNSFGRFYFKKLPRNLEPKDIPQAFLLAKEDFIEWGTQRNHFIHNVYKTERKDELKTLVWDPLLKELD